MATSRVSLSTSEYVRVNFGLNPITIEAAEGQVHVAVTTNQPSLNNKAFHRVSDRARLHFEHPDANVWVLATTGVQKCVVTEEISPDLVSLNGHSIPSQALQFLDNIAFVDHFGQSIVGQLESNISVNFGYQANTEYDLKPHVLSGDGAVDDTLGYLQLSGTTGTSSVESRDSMRYSNGRGFVICFTASFDGAGVGWAGGFDPESKHDGFPLRYTGSTDTLEFGYLKEAVFTSPIEIDHVALGLDLSKINIWAVVGGFLGTANPTLLVRMDTWKVAGVIQTEGRMVAPHVRLPAFPIGARIEGDMTIRSGSWHAATVGSAGNVQDRGFSYPNTIFTGPTTGANPANGPKGKLNLGGVAGVTNTAFILRAKDLFQGEPNKIRADIINVAITVVPTGAGSGVVQSQLVGNATSFSPSPVYSDVDTLSSVLEVDDNANAQSTGRYASGGFLVGEPKNVPYTTSAGGQQRFANSIQTQIEQLQLDGIAGETLTLLLRDTGGNSVDVYWHVTWVERQV